MFTAHTVYGALELSSKTLTIMAIVAASLLVLSTVMYIMQLVVPGLVVQFVGFVLTATLIATWWTSNIDWGSNGPFPVVGGLIIAVIAAVGPPAIAEIDN